MRQVLSRRELKIDSRQKTFHRWRRCSSLRQSMRAIIIAAGRGRRLMPTTADTPKCFAEIQGKRMLDWARESLTASGIKEICFIGGYQIEKVRRDYPHFTFRHNDNWENNNILLSLMY